MWWTAHDKREQEREINSRLPVDAGLSDSPVLSVGSDYLRHLNLKTYFPKIVSGS